mmetsp:Transcript_19378/g.45356  ORF Transcript_19378/g.45356 Transcript_19378/m.45356 type:complete len:109 (+) Transcript_19378:3-329(+)
MPLSLSRSCARLLNRVAVQKVHFSSQQTVYVPSVMSIYKNCLRLVEHAGGENKNINVPLVKSLVRKQFENNALADKQQADELKSNAMNALTTYVFHLSQKKEDFIKRE